MHNMLKMQETNNSISSFGGGKDCVKN